MSRNALVIGGLSLVVLGMLVGVWLWLSRDNQGVQANGSAAGADRVATAERHGGATPPPGSPGPAGAPPAVPAAGDGDPPREYVVGGMTIRDHRSGPPVKIDVPLPVHPAEGHKVDSATTHAISQRVKTVIYDCAAGLPREARGDKPRLEGQIIIAIKNHELSVTAATVQLRNLTGDLGPTKQCIESKSVGLGVAAPGETDVDNYTVNISFAIP